jgi:hypothetical protein
VWEVWEVDILVVDVVVGERGRVAGWEISLALCRRCSEHCQHSRCRLNGHNGFVVCALHARLAEVTCSSHLYCNCYSHHSTGDMNELYSNRKRNDVMGKNDLKNAVALLGKCRSDREALSDTAKELAGRTQLLDTTFSQWHCDIRAVGFRMPPSIQPTRNCSKIAKAPSSSEVHPLSRTKRVAMSPARKRRFRRHFSLSRLVSHFRFSIDQRTLISSCPSPGSLVLLREKPRLVYTFSSDITA